MWNTVGAAIYMLCLWMITVVVVWLSDDYINAGYLALAMAITGFFYPVAQQNMRAYQVSDIEGEYTDSEYVSSRAITSIISIVLCLIFVYVFDYTSVQRYVVIIYMLFRATESMIDVFHGIDQKAWRMDYVGISYIIRGVLLLAAFSLFGWLYGLLPAIIGMFVVSATVGILFDLSKAKKLSQLSINLGKPVLLLIKRCIPLMLASLIGVFLISFTRYSVEKIHGTEALGIYASVATPSIIMQVIATFIFNPLANIFASYRSESNIKSFVKLLLLVCVGLVVISFMFFIIAQIFGHWGLTLLFGESISPYTYLLPGAILAAGATVMLWFMNVVFSVTRDLSGFLIGSFIGAVVAILATNIFLIRFGLDGANHILILSQGVAVIFLIIRFAVTGKKILSPKQQ